MSSQQPLLITNQLHLLEQLVRIIGKFPLICPVCGEFASIYQVDRNNLRESCLCSRCLSTNRHRQMAWALNKVIKTNNLSQAKNYHGIIFNTESYGSLHNQLIKNKKYIFSKYFGSKYKSGEKVNGVPHQDLMKLSFKKETINIVLSSDVFEHISDPYRAHREIYRVLKKKGVHIFTVPFLPNTLLDDHRADVVKGKVVHYQKPIYHLDGIRPDLGALVYNIFGTEMLVNLAKIGFDVKMYRLYDPLKGILGGNAFVFCATRI